MLAVFLVGMVLAAIAMAYVTWRVSDAADAAEARAATAEDQVRSQQTVILVQNAQLQAQAAELKRLTHRSRLLTNELRGSDDRAMTQAWRHAKPEPFQWAPEVRDPEEPFPLTVFRPAPFDGSA